MSGPTLYVVVGVNRRTGDLVAWYFAEQEANAHVEALNVKEDDGYAYKVEECPAGHPMPKPYEWRR